MIVWKFQAKWKSAAFRKIASVALTGFSNISANIIWVLIRLASLKIFPCYHDIPLLKPDFVVRVYMVSLQRVLWT